MLDKINLKKIMLKEEYKQEVPPLKQKMGELQQKFKQAKVPVIVLFEGWGASGKGSLMSNVILTMDPRGFHVESTTPPTLEERRHPYLWRFWKSCLPGAPWAYSTGAGIRSWPSHPTPFIWSKKSCGSAWKASRFLSASFTTTAI